MIILIIVPITYNLFVPKHLSKQMQIDSVELGHFAQLTEVQQVEVVRIIDNCGITAPDSIWAAIVTNPTSCLTKRKALWISWFESNHNCSVVNSSGHTGCPQFSPRTFDWYCVPRGWTDIKNTYDQFDCMINLIDAGQEYDQWLTNWEDWKVKKYYSLVGI